MLIDEEGSFVMKNDKAESDHNSILISVNLDNIDHQKNEVKTVWKTTASEKQWDAYINKLKNFRPESNRIMNDETLSIDSRYTKWHNEIGKIAGSTLGKKSIKLTRPEKFSEHVSELRKEKRYLKNMISSENDDSIKNELKQQYIHQHGLLSKIRMARG